ncbi:HNH endonuclease signature motif containing protein [Ralstonia sp. RL]|uniref:HNH endonuclease n=1 Tax=Ralstonia sp. RL TaxID=1839756 RepID=UPI00257A0981|nr:HNH endonuclease signature motif containing protein [Ralstonia sp. RL]
MVSVNKLKPTKRELVADILASLGLPAPSSLYDWCYGKADGTCVMFQWFDKLQESEIGICFLEDSEAWASDNQGIAETVQINRATAVHNLVLNAYIKKRPIHVAIVDGTIKETPLKDIERKGRIKETGQAKFRVLDNELWWPHHRDPLTGQIVVVRGVPQPEDFDPLADYSSGQPKQSEKINSPDDAPSSPQKKFVSATAIFDRDPEVVRQAKERAKDGRCEYCKELGFSTGEGKYYLEAHHVIPLSLGGPDRIWNIAVLCANDHKRAHFGIDRNALRDHLIHFLESLYPTASEELRDLAMKMDKNTNAYETLEADAQS